MDILLYCLTGLLIGVLSGLLGIGGGLVAVPSLSWILAHQGVDERLVMHIAIGTSLSTIIFPSIASIRAFNQQGEVEWQLVRKLIPGIIVGTLSGVMIAHFLSTRDLKVVFGLFVLMIAFRLLFEKKQAVPLEIQDKKIKQDGRNYHAIALTTGLSAGMLGVGGSIIIIPYLLHSGFSIRQASGTSITCALPIAIIGVVSIIISSWGTPGLPAYSTGYIDWAATLGIAIPSIFCVPLGAWLGKRLPQDILRKVFAIFLIFVSLNMLGAVHGP